MRKGYHRIKTEVWLLHLVQKKVAHGTDVILFEKDTFLDQALGECRPRRVSIVVKVHGVAQKTMPELDQELDTVRNPLSASAAVCRGVSRIVLGNRFKDFQKFFYQVLYECCKAAPTHLRSITGH